MSFYARSIFIYNVTNPLQIDIYAEKKLLNGDFNYETILLRHVESTVVYCSQHLYQGDLGAATI